MSSTVKQSVSQNSKVYVILSVSLIQVISNSSQIKKQRLFRFRLSACYQQW